MPILNRRAAVALGALALLLVRPVTPTTTQGTDWSVGDVFVGLGDADGYLAYLQDDPATPDIFEAADDLATPVINEMDLFNLLGTYRVFGETGTVKEDLKLPVHAITTGCAVDRLTGNFWATSFDGNTVDALAPMHDPTLGHQQVASLNIQAHVSNPPGVAAVESIVFDRDGNFYVGIPDEEIDFDYENNAVQYDGFGTVVKFSPTGARLAEYRVPVNLYPSGYQLNPTDRTPRGVDWIDLSADGATLFYTSEDRFIRTFKFDTMANQPGAQPGPGAGNALTIGGTTYPSTPGVWGYVSEGTGILYALRLLPPGNGAGGVLVAGPSGLYRTNGSGAQVMFTFAPGGQKFFAANLTPDARFVWTATQQGQPALFKFHVGTGQLMPLGTGDRIPMPAPVNGLCVKLEYTSQSVDCVADPSNPLCRAIELCTAASPGDDDGDGLGDAIDPDCAIPGAPEVCTNGVDDDRNGLIDETCARANTENDSVSFSFDSRVPGESRVYSATNLPDGIRIDASSGQIGGTLTYASAGVHDVTVTVLRIFSSGPQESESGSFTWTVADKNGPPVLSIPDQVSDEGTYVNFVVPQATDPDGDPVTQGWPGPRPDHLVYNPVARTLSGTLADVTVDTTTTLHFDVRDDHGNSTHVAFNWTVRDLDQAPPVCAGATLSGGPLWPPNHRMVPFTVAGVTDPDGDALTIAVTRIHQNEPTNSTGDGNTAIDGAIEGERAWIRAERAGTRTTRVYRVGFTASDGAASCSGFAYTAVVHDQGKTPTPSTAVWYDSTVATPALKPSKKAK